jgi:flagellar biosynthesis/type III secretory pathway M-ring protein FliF/YscJ
MKNYGHQLTPQQGKRQAIAIHRTQAAQNKRQVALIRVLVQQQPELVIKLLKRWLNHRRFR